MTDRYLTDEDRLTGRMKNHDPADLNAIARIVTGEAAPERHPLFSVRYGIAVGLLESDWLESLMRRHRAAAWEECFESGTPWINPYTDTPG